MEIWLTGFSHHHIHRSLHSQELWLPKGLIKMTSPLAEIPSALWPPNCVHQRWGQYSLTLSCLPDTVDDPPTVPVASLLSIETNPSLLQSIHLSYKSDLFYIKLVNAMDSITGLTITNGLIYVGNCLVIPRTGSLWEDLFCLTYDNLGHFGFDKSYAAQHNSYYCPTCSVTYKKLTSLHVLNANVIRVRCLNLWVHYILCQSQMLMVTP